MRKLMPLLMFIVVGCHHCPRFLDCTSCHKDVGDCVVETPCPKPAQKCEQAPEIEIKAPKPIHLKIPPQKIVLQNEMQPQPVGQPQSFVPQQPFAPQSYAPPQQPQQVMMMPVVQPQSAPSGRARPGFTFDFFQLHIPYPRLIAVPDAAPAMQAVAMVAPQSYAPQSFVPQSAPPQQHVMVPVPGTIDVPVQSMMKVPYQAHVPVPVQPQSFVPQSAVCPPGMIPVIPQGTSFQPQGHVPPQMQGITMQQAEEFCRLVEQMKKQMSERK